MTNSTNTMPVRALCDLAQSGTLLKGDLTVTYTIECFELNNIYLNVFLISQKLVEV